MQDVWRSCERYCRRQEIRENSLTRRGPRGGHLLVSGKNRDEVERCGYKTARHQGGKFWKNLLGRNLRRTGNQDPDDAPPRTRLAPCGGSDRWGSYHQWAAVTAYRSLRIALIRVCILPAISVSLSGCSREQPPQKAYEQIVSEINHGDLSAARRAADEAITRYGPDSQEWSWRFRILKAQVLISQSAPQEALAILRGELPPGLATKDVAVRKILLEGTAYRSAQEFGPAEKQLNEAKRLAESFQPQLLCEVLNAIGVLEIAEKKYTTTEDTLHQALSLTRQQNNSRQEASVLLNLALVATNQERFDAAIDRNQGALQLSRSLGMQSLVATILGNLGWAYSELGDFDGSL